MNIPTADTADPAPAENSGEDEVIRHTLARLAEKAGDGYAALSRMLGRNPAYIQQYVKRGVPRRLSETDRRLLAQHFGVSESLLGAPGGATQTISPSPSRHECLEIPRHGTSGRGPDSLLFDRTFLQGLPEVPATWLTLHQVEGDSMAPTLHAGDLVLVNTADRKRIRDGIYAIETNSVVTVKRLSINPATRLVTILADNASYPSFANCDPEQIRILGRVVWLGRLL